MSTCASRARREAWQMVGSRAQRARWCGMLFLAGLASTACETEKAPPRDAPPAQTRTDATVMRPRDAGPAPTTRLDAATRPPTDAEPEPVPREDAGGEPEPGEEVAHQREECEVISGSEGPMGALSLRVEEVVRGLEVPWDLAFLPNGDMLITERPGRLRMVRAGQLVAAPVLTVTIAEIPGAALGSEGGLLGVVLHPEFATNREFFLYYTTRDDGGALINQLAVYRLAEDGKASRVRVLLDDLPAGDHHQGGRMRIGPDGKLYVGVGAFDPALAQRADQLAGKLLRLELDGSVPSDNPTPGSYVYLTGVRNTQGYDWFDAKHMLVMDHGPTSIDPGVPEKGWDEFNVARAGENLGWPKVRMCSAASGTVEPVLTWRASLPPAGAVIYTGSAIPEWKGSLIVGVLGLSLGSEGKQLHRIQVDPTNPYRVLKREVYLKNTYGRIRTVIMGPDQHLYFTTSNCEGRGSCPASRDRVMRVVGTN